MKLFWFFVGLFLLGPTPVYAHGSSKEATNYLSVIKTISPHLDGVLVEFDSANEKLIIKNNTNTDVVVLGYENEPYLRVGQQGSFANTNSPAWYLNSSYSNYGSIPAGVNAKNEPLWKKVPSESEISWHDHRTHWMSDLKPPIVSAEPKSAHVLIPDWTVNFTQGEQLFVVHGKLLWSPGPSPMSWYLVMLALFVATVLFCRWLIGQILMISGLLIAQLAHVFAQLGLQADLLVVSALVITTGLVGIVNLMRKQPQGWWFVAFVGAVIAILVGVSDLSAFSHSQLISRWNDLTTRLVVAFGLSVGAGIFLVSVRILIRARAD